LPRNKMLFLNFTSHYSNFFLSVSLAENSHRRGTYRNVT